MALRRRRAGAALTLLAALLFAGWRLAFGDPLTDAVEARALDLRFALRGAAPAPPGVAVVAIDETAARRFGAGAPLRRALARAVRRIDRAGASALAVDLLMPEPTGADAELAAALAAHGRAVLAAAAVSRAADAGGARASPETARALERSAFGVVLAPAGPASPDPAPPDPAPPMATPTPGLAAAALLGHVNLRRDPDRVARRMPGALPLTDGGFLPPMPLTAARLALGLARDAAALKVREALVLGGRAVPLLRDGTLPIDHLGPAGTVDTIALGDLLAASDAALAERLAGRAVFVGATAESFGDLIATPFGPDTPGVETLAAAAARMMAGAGLAAGPPAWASTLLLAAAGALLARRAALIRAPARAAAATAAVLLAAAATVQAAFAPGGLLLDAAGALAPPLAAAIGFGALGRARERREALRLAAERDRLALHVTPLIGRAPGETAQAAVAFVDMVGSTGRAETAGAAEAARLVAAAQARIATAAREEGGAVVEIWGDGALTLFGFDGAPLPAERALRFLRRLAAPPAEPDAPAFRATAHWGEVTVADLGGGARRHLSIAGDAVNVAAKMQEAAKTLDARLAVSAELAAEAGAPGWLVPRGPAALPGRGRPVELWTAR